MTSEQALGALRTLFEIQEGRIETLTNELDESRAKVMILTNALLTINEMQYPELVDGEHNTLIESLGLPVIRDKGV